MFAGTLSAKTMLAVTGPFSLEEMGTMAAAVLLPALITWLVMRSKLKRAQREASATLEQLRTESVAALQAEQTKAAALAAETAKTSAAATASFADLQQRFNTHREVAERRANDASQQIARLESELTATREIAAQLAPTQSRIKDLETALAAEQGRIKAQEQAIAATNARAADFEKRMIEAQDLVIKHKGEMQASLVELKKIRDEQDAYAAAGGAEAELTKAREAHQQAEAKITNLQRALKAAEARVEMVQKEFMNAVGLATAPTPGTSAGASDKKLREQEEKLMQLEAESRKRAREDGYKIAELEYRLSEALEAVKTSLVQAKTESVAVAADPAPPDPMPVDDAPKTEAPPVVAAKEETPAADPLRLDAPMAGIPMAEVPADLFSTLEAPPPPAVETPSIEFAAAMDGTSSGLDLGKEDDAGPTQESTHPSSAPLG
ncbi:MAG: hypothetical protein B7Z37_15015 [Verrucomicrobia bacterium 12-59-8]|nr:MAG: hypothetical protein B7Z37_15015 [Verrucomicrobia bacterium 12-59-8]